MPAWSWFAFLALHNRPMTLNFRAYSFIRWCSEVFVKYFGPEPRQAQERTLWRPAARSCANSGHSGTAWRTRLFDLVSSLKSGPTTQICSGKKRTRSAGRVNTKNFVGPGQCQLVQFEAQAGGDLAGSLDQH
jgi:hypothetical protein